MTARIAVRQGEQGRVWVFAVDLDGEDLSAFTRRNGGWPLQQALGAEALDPNHVEVFPVSDLEGVGLARYLEEGHGVPPDQLADMRARLDAQAGTVMVLTSRAVRGATQTLTPRTPLRLLASFSEEHSPVRFEPLPSGGAAPPTAIPEKTRGTSNSALSGRVAMVALLVLFALVGVMIWIAA